MAEAARQQETETITLPPARKVYTEDLDFLADADSAYFEQSPRGGRWLVWGIVAFIAIALIWMSLAKVDEITRGEGKVIPSQQVQVIQNLEGGILAELFIDAGDRVQKGQVLLRIDDTRFTSSLRESRSEYLSLKAKAARLRAEANGEKFIAPQEVGDEMPLLAEQENALYQSRQSELRNNVNIYERQVEQRQQELTELRSKKRQLESSLVLVERELDLTKPLVKEGAISEVEVLRLEREVNDLQGEIRNTSHAMAAAQAKLSEARAKLAEVELRFRAQARLELSDTLADLNKLSESSTALQDRVQRTLVRSPVNGTVKQIKVNTIGGVIKPGEDLVEIVPSEDTLVFEAKIRPADIGFLHPGQKAIVKFSAYDFAIYGGLPATLEHISADTITDEKDESYYLVRVRTEKSFLGSVEDPLPIIPGMVGQVDILTGKKTILSYLIKPVLRAQQTALTER